MVLYVLNAGLQLIVVVTSQTLVFVLFLLLSCFLYADNFRFASLPYLLLIRVMNCWQSTGTSGVWQWKVLFQQQEIT